MNRNCYRLVFSTTAGMMVPLAEIARGRGKAASSTVLVGALIASVVLANVAQAEMPVASTGGAIPNFVTYGQAGYQVNGNQAFVNQVGNKSILNWQSFNVSAGNNVQFRQVDSSGNLVAGASFTSLNRIWDNNPSVIAGALSQAAGQKADVILVNSNGIAFMGGSQVNLNNFTASSLNIDNSFVLNSMLSDNKQAQFEKAVDGTEGRGFIKVLQGAKITAGSQGRVMLIAPTVVNRGSIVAPDGQVILAAASKVYLRAVDDANLNVRGLMVEVDSPTGLNSLNTANTSVKNGLLDGQAVALTDVAQDKLGHATNLGELSTPRGNVTMVGYAVNQSGIARATTSVVANGSVYLMAKDTSVLTANSRDSLRGGRVVLGEGSLTEVQPEVADLTSTVDGTTGAGLAKQSEVRVLGQTVYMANGATITAPAGKVDLIAIDNPSTLPGGLGPLDTALANASTTARVHVASGATINVSGLTDVAVSAARNSVEVELRGDELKDSPVNQAGPLRGEKAYLDVNRALANANAGKSTLIAKDSLEAYQARLERTVAERSTTGGTVNIRSEGETILEAGAGFNLSGGSVKYTAANIKTTLLSANGQLVDLADANAETRYDGIATRYVIDYGRWNQKEVIDLGQSFKFDPGYREGKDAGKMSIQSMGPAFMRASVVGSTVEGDLQRATGTQPKGVTLTIGTAAVGGDLKDYKINQKLVLDRAAVYLPSSFAMGSALSDGLKDTLTLDADLLAKDKVASLKVYTNQAAEVRSALRAPVGGGVTIAANNLLVSADIEVPGGVIDLAARNNAFAPTNDTLLRVDAGVRISARGAWVNELPAVVASGLSLPPIDGGSISLVADALASSGNFDSRGTVALGQGVVIDASGGARVGSTGKITAGKGGSITLSGYAVEGLADNVLAYGLEKGGKLNLTTNRIKIGGAAENGFGTVVFDPLFFTKGGFSDFGLTALSTLEVAQNTAVRPTVANRELMEGFATEKSGATLADFSRLVVRDDRLRQVANLSLSAKQSGAGTGELLIGKGASIVVDAQGKIALEARNTLNMQGALVAHGGVIDVALDRSSGVVSSAVNENALWLGKDASIDVSGIAKTYLDGRGLTQGTVLAGGAVNLNAKTGYVVTESGSSINVSGTMPVKLGVRNESGGLGRLVGSDAGVLTVFGEEGILLDGAMSAQAGGAGNRGGVLNVTLSKNAHVPGQIFDSQARTLSLAATVAPQTSGMSAGAAIPVTGEVRARIGTDKLEAAGFDRIRFSSRDAIALENGLNMGTGRALPLREVKLDAARIETLGGNAAITAETLLVGNYNPDRVGSTSVVTNTGALTLSAQQLELAGKLRLEGMARAQFNGLQGIALAGVTAGAARPVGELNAAADLVFNGAVVAPSTYTKYSVLAPGKSVSFTRNTDEPTQPLSAMGSLTIEAQDIVQDGNLWVPFGQIDFKASESLKFKSGSLTSVAAASGSLLPFGKVINGRSWVYDVDADKVPTGQLEQVSLNEKSIRTAGKSVDMQAGAKINLAGGGDMQAYEFTVGPGGSRDILADANTYGILPSYKGGVAPGDTQEAKGFNRAVGDAVYLSGMPGLADGMYTLLPAHYALLPGAYAVKLNTGIKDLMPGQAFSGQDGVRMASGYLSDSRANAPRDAAWQGIQVLTGDQVRARSEFTLTRASDFFADGKNRPQDAGLLSIATSGTGNDSLKLDATYRLEAGSGGRGAAVDISALKLAITSGSPAGIAADVTQIDVDKVNALGARSLFVGGTRVAGGDATTLTVGAQIVTLANDAAHALKAPEVILAASDTLTLKSGSVIDAQGDAGDAGHYTTPGNGALVRAASTTATFTRSGSPDRSQGRLVGEAGSLVRAADSITLDATKENAIKGTVEFRKNGAAVAGNLAVGATRINFGAAPASANGITYSQAELDGLNSLKGLTLTSYNTFDMYGAVNVGGLDGNGKPTLQSLTLQGAGLAGIDNTGKTANLRAKNITLNNSAAVAFVPGAALGTGALAVLADTLTLGDGNKSVQGFSSVAITANELVGAGKGKTTVAAPVTINVARIRGEEGADQTLTATGALAVASRAADRTLAQVTALGAKWTLAGTSVDFNTRVELPSGQFKLNASAGDVNLSADARVDVAGRNVSFFDVTRPTWGGSAEFSSDTGNVSFASGAKVDVSAAPGADAGSLVVRAVNGAVAFADGSVQGTAPVDADGKRGEGARVEVDTGTLASFSNLNTALNTGGFDLERQLRVRNGNVIVANTDTVQSKTISFSVDRGQLDVAGELASNEDGGRIALFAKGNINVLATARLSAPSIGSGREGGRIEIGTTDGSLNLATGSTMNVTAGSGGKGGTVQLRAPRISGETDVAVTALNSTITGARAVTLEAVKTYNNINTLIATGASSGTTLSLATINSDNTAFSGNHSTIKAGLGKANDSDFHILSGVEVRSTGDLTLGNGAATTDWNLQASRAGGEAGVLTLRAAGNLDIKSNLSDGFSNATAFSSGSTPATLVAGDSWAYRLVAGADSAAANPLAVAAAKNFTLAAGKLIRTGTGDIRIAAGQDIKLAANTSVIYTAGRIADAVQNFVAPTNTQRAYFTQDGGDVSLAAGRDIEGQPSTQLYSDWLFRQGRLTADGTTYAVSQGSPAWWVRFDQFKQGIGTLGGGDVTVRAGGQVKNLSASAPTQGRMASATPDANALVKTGGGTVRVQAGTDLLGGQYFADNGDVLLKVGGKVGSGQVDTLSSTLSPVYSILALGDGQARVQAQEDVNIQAILNPHLLMQTFGSTDTSNIGAGTTRDARRTLFSTYGGKSGAKLESLTGNVTLHDPLVSDGAGSLKNIYPTVLASSDVLQQTGSLASLNYLPPSLSVIAFQGDVVNNSAMTLLPAANSQLELLAKKSVQLNAGITMSDRDPALIASAARPVSLPSQIMTSQVHAVTPVHVSDSTPARIYANEGDVKGVATAIALTVPKSVAVRAGRDVRDFTIQAQHPNAGDRSVIEAGRDVVFSAGTNRSDTQGIFIGGPGRIEVTAGRNIDLGTSGGIVSRGDLDNPSLSGSGADIQVLAGAGSAGLDVTGAINRLIARLDAGAADEPTLWLARWLTGNKQLNATDALAAVRTVMTQDTDARRTSVRNLVFTALRQAGRDANKVESGYGGDFARGYAALELVFPGIGEKNPDGSFKNYQGDVNLFASRIKTERDGNIEFMIPGGEMIVGRANTSDALVNPSKLNNDVLGVVAAAKGDIQGFSRGSMLVNQSRILTVGGGDVMLWSSEGDIDAGKGKKTAAAAPPPIIKTDPKTGAVTQELQGAASGSGIAALSSGGAAAGDVDLIAPKGTVNAGDAGIRAGNLNIAAAVVQGADNISVSGKSSGTPIADTSAVTATASGATKGGDDLSKTTAALSQSAADSAKNAQALKDSFKPSFVRVDVLGFGE